MNETKVVKLQILPSDEQIQYLLDTMKEYTRICNVVSQWIFENSFEISHHKVNAALYHTIRKQSTLTSRLVQDTFRTVCARYKTVQTQMSKTDTGYVDTDNKKIHKTLEWLWKPINFKSLQCDLTRDLDYSFIDGGKQISISDLDLEEDEDEIDTASKRLSAEYAILGISGRSGVMSVDVINAKGQPMSLKIGSPLPTGHVVSEIGADYVKFSRDGHDDYLYVGRTIDGIVPTLGLVKEK